MSKDTGSTFSTQQVVVPPVLCVACGSTAMGPWRELPGNVEWRRECLCGVRWQIVRNRHGDYKHLCQSEDEERRAFYRHLGRALRDGNELGAERWGLPPSHYLFDGGIVVHMRTLTKKARK